MRSRQVSTRIEKKEAHNSSPPGIYGNNGQGDWDKYEKPDGSSTANGQSSGMGSVFGFFSLKGMFKAFVKYVVQLIYETAALCINTIRDIYLIILAILGPLV